MRARVVAAGAEAAVCAAAQLPLHRANQPLQWAAARAVLSLRDTGVGVGSDADVFSAG